MPHYCPSTRMVAEVVNNCKGGLAIKQRHQTKSDHFLMRKECP